MAVNLALGGAAGVTASTACYPLDTLRRNLQMEGCNYIGTIDCLKHILRQVVHNAAGALLYCSNVSLMMRVLWLTFCGLFYSALVNSCWPYTHFHSLGYLGIGLLIVWLVSVWELIYKHKIIASEFQTCSGIVAPSINRCYCKCIPNLLADWRRTMCIIGLHWWTCFNQTMYQALG